jgi:Kef-type K+ transport system membrane component KefB
VLVITAAVFGKVVGCGGVAKLAGMSWREAGAVGFLMNTRGLVELIVLNIGLETGILSTPVFTIMVLMAVCTTVMTVRTTSVAVHSIFFNSLVYNIMRILVYRCRQLT